MAIKKRFAKAGSSFTFWFIVEMMHDQIIKGLRKFLSSIQPEDIPRMVRNGEFPPMEDLDFSAVGDYSEHLEKIPLYSPNDDGDPPGLVEYLALARPDLVKAVQDMGKRGAEYLVKLQLHLLDLVKHPEKSLGKSTEYKAKGDTVMATCDVCHNSWPVSREQASSINECPFCHT